jgi:integrase
MSIITSTSHVHTLGLPSLSQMPEALNHPELDGAAGRNRATDQRQIRAKNDYEAVLCWLNEYRHKQTTYRSYQKESERLLLWCITQHKKALSDLDRDDFEVYFNFLDNPQPREKWCAAKGYKVKRGSLNWKPFEGPLSKSAKDCAITIINSLLNYLVYARYLSFNPIGLMKRRGGQQQNTELQRIKVWERILEDDEWEALLLTLEEMPEESKGEQNEKERLRFLISILFFLGLRINELETHCWGAFREVQSEWWFFVRGKGDKLGKIPVNSHLLNAIGRYRLYCGYSEIPNPEEELPIIQSWRTGKAVTARHMNRLLKNLAIRTSEKFKDNPVKASKLKKFSPHWLRHLSATMQDRMGVQFKHIKANHRHESEETTRRYVHSFDNERHKDMEKLSLRSILLGMDER